MKRTVLLFFIYVFTTSVIMSQTLDPSVNHSSNTLYKTYMKQRATYNTIGWVLLGSGIIIAAASYGSYANNGFNGAWGQEGLFELGGVATIASIPFFIVAGKNKRKAKLALKGESITSGKFIFKSTYPAFSLRINL